MTEPAPKPVPGDLRDLFDQLTDHRHAGDATVIHALALVLQRHEEAVRKLITATAAVEYGTAYRSGGYLTWPPIAFKVASLAERIELGQQHGGKVGRRRIIVLDDWKNLRKGAKR
jgi:hypothetical protein